MKSKYCKSMSHREDKYYLIIYKVGHIGKSTFSKDAFIKDSENLREGLFK